MAKKKASPKKAKSKKVIAKVNKKSAVKAKPAKKPAAKSAQQKKKALSKSISKKASSKKPAKATLKKGGNVKKVAQKVAPKKEIKKVSKSSSHSQKSLTPRKTIDLSNFVTPLDDRLLVQVSGAEKMTPGGLYIPDTVADVSGNLEGFVVAVGRGHMNKKGQIRPMDVRVGDRVVFSEFAGTKIKIQNEDLLIIRESDVMGVVSK